MDERGKLAGGFFAGEPGAGPWEGGGGSMAQPWSGAGRRGGKEG